MKAVNGEFSHTHKGRRLSTVAGLIFMLGMLGLGLALSAPGWWMLTVILPALMLIWSIIRNPIYGLSLDAHELRWFTPKVKKNVPLSTISHIRVETWTDGPDLVILKLHSGGSLEVPTFCLPARGVLPRELQARGIKVQQP